MAGRLKSKGVMLVVLVVVMRSSSQRSGRSETRVGLIYFCLKESGERATAIDETKGKGPRAMAGLRARYIRFASISHDTPQPGPGSDCVSEIEIASAGATRQLANV